MAVITLNIPDECLNKLNNYYIGNFEYDIYTHLYSFLFHEMDNCSEYPSNEPDIIPRPSIRKDGNGYKLWITYPDGSNVGVKGDFEYLSKVLIEWSKYSFEKDKRETVLTKFDKHKYISKNKGLWDVKKHINGKTIHFGNYQSLENAIPVRDFLVKHDWDLKYSTMTKDELIKLAEEDAK